MAIQYCKDILIIIDSTSTTIQRLVLLYLNNIPSYLHYLTTGSRREINGEKVSFSQLRGQSLLYPVLALYGARKNRIVPRVWGYFRGTGVEMATLFTFGGSGAKGLKCYPKIRSC